MKKYIWIIIIFLLSQNFAIADSGKPAYSVLIDTDGALDDFRAINMFLAGKNFNVLGITCSQGTLGVESCFKKVNSLLTYYHHEGIPVGVGNSTNTPLPAWNAFAESISWSLVNGNIQQQKSFELLEKAIESCKEKITLIALGSLNTYAEWIKNTKQDLKKIEQIVWYSEPDFENGFNYQMDSKAYDEVLLSKIPIVIVSKGRRILKADNNYINRIKPLNSIYTKNILSVLSAPSVREKIDQGHSPLWDDLVPLFLSHPDLFVVQKNDGFQNAVLKQTTHVKKIYQDIAQIFNSKVEAMNRVFIGFPVQKDLYKKEYAAIINNTINKYGLAEWKAITLTNEVHGHTGIYSIIGAKAGIRACEYFNAGVNNLYAVSYAGNKPPLSCYNDGVQISTGATIGQGLIKIADSVIQTPTVIFEFNKQKIKLSFKKETAAQMQADIKKGVEKYGLSDSYWKYIEELAKKYWTDFNRHDIFVIERL